MSEEFQSEISLLDLFYILWSKIIWIIAITAIFVIVGGIYAFKVLKDEYTSTASVLVLVENENESQSQNFTFGQRLVDTYTVLILSDLVINKVRAELDDNYTASEIRKSISVSGVKETIIIKLSVTRGTAEESQQFAKAFVSVVSDVTKDFEGFDNIEVLDCACLPVEPSGPNRVLYLLIATILGGIVSVGLILSLELMNGSIKSSKDIENKLKIRVLGTIPEYDISQGSKL